MKKLLLSAAAVLVPAAWAAAGPVYNFVKIPNQYANQNIGLQLSVEVLDEGDVNDVANHVGTNQVGFLFKNNVGVVSSVTEIYFDDGSLFGIADVYNSSGTNFGGPGATPGDLPGGDSITPEFVTTQYFNAESSGATTNGINSAAEQTLIVFDLKPTKTYASVLASLVLGLTDGGNDDALRIGLHVRSIGSDGQSAAFINTAAVPLPAAAWMGIGLLGCVGGVGYIRKRRYVAE